MSKNNTNNKKSNRTIFITFVVALFAIYIAGFFIGRLAVHLEGERSFEELVLSVKAFAIHATPVVLIVVCSVGIIISTAVFLSCRAMYKKLLNDKDNDALWDTLEDRLNVAMILTNIFSIIDLFLFLCCLYSGLVMAEKDYSDSGMAIMIAPFVLFIVASIVGVLIPKWTLDIEKHLNPEKRGNVLDFQFQKVWMNSCDEAERLIAYKAGYKAFLNTNTTCIVMCIVAFVVSVSFRTNVFALVCVCVIWFVNNLSYMLRAAKLERRK
jgi:hypothetical protein